MYIANLRGTNFPEFSVKERGSELDWLPHLDVGDLKYSIGYTTGVPWACSSKKKNCKTPMIMEGGG